MADLQDRELWNRYVAVTGSDRWFDSDLDDAYVVSDENKDRLKAWVDSPDRQSLYLFSTSGLGPSFVASMLVKRLLAKDLYIRQHYVPRWLSRLEDEGWELRSDTEIIRNVQPDVLVFDQFDLTLSNLRVLRIIASIMRDRCNNGKPVVATGRKDMMTLLEESKSKNGKATDASALKHEVLERFIDMMQGGKGAIECRRLR